MKKNILLMMGLFFSNMVFANNHKISIYNHSGQDIFYAVVHTVGVPYALKKDGAGEYTTKFSDSLGVTIKSGLCKYIDGKVCSHMGENINCVKNQFYHADNIQSITVISPSSCKILCKNGGDTSCKK